MSALVQIGGVTVLWPEMLWLLAALPLLVGAYLWLLARRRRTQAQLPGLIGASATPGGRLRRHLPPALFLLALGALIAAVSRPQAVLVLPSMHKDVVLVLDTSGSMRATDVKPNRLAAAQAAARIFIENRPWHSRIGIVSVSATASLVQSLTDNREDLLQAIERVQLQRGTALGSGIYTSLSTLIPTLGIDPQDGPSRFRPGEERKPVPPGSNRSVAIVLLTDGENTHGPDPVEAAKLAADLGVRIYTVGVGRTEGVALGFNGWSMRVRLDEATLKKMAATTLGEYYAASSEGELQRVYEHLSARMVVENRRATEVTAVLVGFGALLLAISAMCSVLWFNRVL